ncbi:carboxypeptidase regulatory-like domain-containing protein [Streptacidiphilus cavernicola]|uniref:Carboxypeptidase regulatory-like domain-containing protein n=1 Tax=Streptacidiphilus cavernicola TaxID=3342716 RepID=A0ABV6VWR1_9ACTN
MRISMLKRGLTAAVTTAALVALGLQIPLAGAASAAPADAGSSSGHARPAKQPTSGPGVERTCGAPKPGQFTCFAMRRTDITAKKGIQALTAAPDGYGPSDLRSAYDLPADGGAGATVAIVDAFDDPAAEADLAVYRDQFGLPACGSADGCFSKVSQRGGTDDLPAPDPGWAGEISLDLDMVSAVAPKAHILLVEADSANFDDLGASVDEAVALGAGYVSNSYGTNYSTEPGSGEDPSEATSMDPYYDHPGVAMVASSGDSAYGVSYPAVSRYVTSVGGTALTRDPGTSRGWAESVWNDGYGGAGSGCSAYEPKPSFQTGVATDCDNRSVADVAAVADPETGVSVYQSYGADGWAVFGGTSASAPIIAGVYADAGAPGEGTYPNEYPYDQPDAVNDVTTGSNGSCNPARLCTAGPGYDGPTGLGTPDGLAAFTSGPHGVISGKVTDHATGKPVSGATVKAGSRSTTTAADGSYTLNLPTGSYPLTASAYGYAASAAETVQLADGATLTEAFALDAVPRQTVTGKVTDGSGHGWPLYARVTADGVPGGPVFTDPATGVFTLTLPQNTDYTLHVTAAYPGYRPATATVAVGTATKSVAVPVHLDPTSTQAVGYKVAQTGSEQTFDSTSGAPAGWKVVDADGTSGSWQFDDPGQRGNLTGGDGGFAIVDSDNDGVLAEQDSSLVSAPVTLGATNPLLTFDTDYSASFLPSQADVDVSADGGSTWTTLWTQTDASFNGHVELSLSDYAGKTVQVRFHYTGSFAEWWQIDDVFTGNRAFTPVPGGLVVGTVKDANTKAAVNGATVTSAKLPDLHATTTATPDDPGLADGFYWGFAGTSGATPLTASATHYRPATAKAAVVPDGAVRRDLTMDAGRLAVAPGTIAKTVGWGRSATQKVTVRNTGTAPATLTVTETPGGTVVAAGKSAVGAGAPLTLVKGHYTDKSLAVAAKQAKGGASGTGSAAAAGSTAQPAAGSAWQPVPDLPVGTGSNAADSYQGTLYESFGFTGVVDTNALYSYKADTGAWTKLAPAEDPRDAPTHGIIGGKLYATGGWGPGNVPDPKTEVYDIASGAWTTAAPDPKPYAGSGSAVLDGKLYEVGGCATSTCGSTDVSVYDPGHDTWSAAAAYPEPVAWESCGAVSGKLYCAGGTTDTGSTTHAYSYDPATNAWSPVADQPTDAWGAYTTAANGRLLVQGGAVDNGTALTNQTWAYDPSADVWSALPNANASLYRGAGAAGFYAIGGMLGYDTYQTGEVLTGYDQTGPADVSWLTESAKTLTLKPGARTTLTVTTNAAAPEVGQPGTYSARLDSVDVSLTVKPPAGWGGIAGKVTAADGTPLAAATVQIDTWAAHYTLRTAADGTYRLWLDTRNNPLRLIVAKDGYQPVTAEAKLKKGATVTRNVTLAKD